MNRLKLTLLAAVSGIAATAAQAQIALPAPGPNDSDAALHAAGATSIQNVLVRVMNCTGKDQKLGNGQPGQSGAAATTGSLGTVAAGNYQPTSPSSTNPALDCSAEANNVQPNFSGKYVGTGSGFGREMWREFKDDFDGSSTGGVTHVFNPFNTVAGDARWTHLQFAFSDTPIAPSDLTDYNNGGSSTKTGTFPGALPTAGAAIQFPLFVLPVAIAYNPVYGKNAAGTNMTFNAKGGGSINGTRYVSIKMTRQIYCKVFNGEITNWNDPLIKTSNSNVSLQDLTNDSKTRWASDGVPIRLTGRLDNSGTTDVFTRHLTSVCGAAGILTGNNKYLRNAESLPYNGNSNVNYTTIREDSNYAPSTAASKFAGSTNMVSGDYWDDASKTIKHLASTPTSTPTGNTGSGLYIVANGGGQLANLINAAPDYALNGVTLNGKVGYISADYVNGSKDSKGLSAAVLQVGGAGTLFDPPAPNYALQAFGAGSTALLPPESDASGGYTPGADTRTVRLPNGSTGPATRDNPLAWTDVLYVSANGNSLDAPTAGYPIVGTTQFFGYTCYLPTNRENVVELLGLMLGGVTKNAAGGTFSVNTYKGTAAASLGVIVASSLDIVPTAYQTALKETFLKASTTSPALAAKNLWIQNKVLLTTKSPGDLTSNPTCSGKTGA